MSSHLPGRGGRRWEWGWPCRKGVDGAAALPDGLQPHRSAWPGVQCCRADSATLGSLVCRRTASRLTIRPFHPLGLPPRPFAPLSPDEAIPTNRAPAAQGFVRVYKRILALGGLPTHPTRPFLTILRHLASPAPSPILVHCTAGKDRSGLAVAVVLSLCGVSDDVVAHEYALSNSGLAHRKEEFVAILVTTEALKGDRAGAERMISVT